MSSSPRPEGSALLDTLLARLDDEPEVLAHVPSFDDSSMASGMTSRLEEEFTTFQAGLKADEEVGACIASFGQVVVIRVTGLSYYNPHLMVIYGVDEQDGQQVRLLQHVHQISLMLKALKVKPGQQARRIGFDHPSVGESDQRTL